MWTRVADFKATVGLIAAGLLVFGAAGAVRAQTETPAKAAPEAEAEAGAVSSTEAEPPSDEDFAKTLVGETYGQSFELDGWTNVAGGLVLPPIYVRHYVREDGTVLVLTVKENAAAAGGSDAKFEVVDALVAGKPRKGYTFSTTCMQGKDYTLRFMGEVSGKDAAEWWTNLNKAWEIDVETGKISSAKTRGVKCTNPNW